MGQCSQLRLHGKIFIESQETVFTACRVPRARRARCFRDVAYPDELEAELAPGQRES